MDAHDLVEKAVALSESGSVSQRVELIPTAGPRRALQRLKQVVAGPGEVNRWLEEARLQAIVGSCPRSLESVKSGLRCWTGFAQDVLKLHGRELPPPLEGLQQWSLLFRHPKTWSNYLSYVKLGCQVLGLSTAVFNESVLRRAKVAIAKRMIFKPRNPMFVRHSVIQRMARLAKEATEWSRPFMCFLCAYVFLLRVPSECLPIVAGKEAVGARPQLYMHGTFRGCCVTVCPIVPHREPADPAPASKKEQAQGGPAQKVSRC